jgi:serine/threonine protein kinase
MAKVKLLDPSDQKRRLERYELIGELAQGGMATVYLARIAGAGGFQRFVAIKKLHPHLAAEEEFIEMFLDEARLAAGIHNPHVVPILEVGQSEAGYYLVMEYIEGDTLARVASRAAGRAIRSPRRSDGRPWKRAPRRSRAAPHPAPLTVRIILDSLAGLHAAHELTDPHGNPLHRSCTATSRRRTSSSASTAARASRTSASRARPRASPTRAPTR